MNKLNRRLLSGASLAALVLGVPSVALADPNDCPSPGGPISTICSKTPTAIAVSTVGVGVVTVSNTGGITAIATNLAAANTTMLALAVNMIATNPGGFAENSLFNPAGSTIHAIAIDLNGSTTAGAVAVAVQQLALSASDAVNLVNNSGAISALAVASAWGVASVNAHANAQAIFQLAVGTEFATNIVDNEAGGLISVDAIAHVSAATTGHAAARATGIIQDAVGSTSAHNVFSNSGTLNVHATALATSGFWGGLGSANAKATIAGNQQVAVGTSVASNALLNSGNINMGAHAVASGISVAHASAWMGIAAFQEAVATGIGGTAANFISNGAAGAIDADGTAFAIASGVASAHAKFGSTVFGFAVIEQVAIAPSGLAKNTLVNAGLITIDGVASAIATSSFGLAVASVTMTVGAIGQFASATSGSAINHLTNSGDIEIGGHAFASAAGTFGFAVANVSMDKAVIHQTAVGGPVASNNFLNGGLIHIHGTATAGTPLAPAWVAIAAAAVTGISQNASASSVAVNNLTNATAGVINVTAKANAYAWTFASAKASAFGISQTANGQGSLGSLAGNNLVNDGVINVAATAVASGFWNANASAVASGVFQKATSATSALNSLVNASGAAINVGANANAFGIGSASAHATATGVFQSASSAFLASNEVNNAGLINVHATAHAVGFSAGTTFAPGALAVARAVGVSQGAFSAEIAANSLTNTGVIDVDALASATGFNIFANAHALGVHQLASSADTAINNVFNGLTAGGGHAVISVNATAVVHATAHGTAFANPTAAISAGGTGILQRINSATFGTNNVTNDGSILVIDRASAFASGFAGAVAAGVGVGQWASGVAFASDALLNNGNITVEAHAFATGGSVALAGTFFFPVYPAGVFQLAVSDTFAGAEVTNNGVIDVDATYTAHTPFSGTFAEAIGGGVGVLQRLLFNSSAAATVTNAGTIGVEAHAFAEAGVSAIAAASVRGISQGLQGNLATSSLGTAKVFNGGILDVTAIATAKGVDSAIASAKALGIGQGVFGYSVAAASVTNAGDIDVSAHAAAQGDDALAFASAAGVRQAVSAWIGGPALAASNNLTNTGAIDVNATALAHGGANIALAFGLGARQSAFALSGALVESNHLLNATGASINVSAHAIATDGNAGSARAAAIGVSQSAWNLFFPSLIAGNVVTNAGSLNVLASAQASGGLFAFASAVATGIRQGASFAVVAADVVNNTGAIAVAANAFAKTTADAYGAFAGAHASGIRQSATGTATSGLGVASVFNLGSLNVAAKASAVGVTSNHGFANPVTASATAIGISQNFAGATSGLAAANVSNVGNITVHASAKANGGSSVAAWAFAQGVTVHADRDFFTAGGVVTSATGPLALALDIDNTGSLKVEADAAGNGLGVAGAGGISASGNFVFGTIYNAGRITVVANAAGAGFGSAYATGIGVEANSFAGVISNTGVIHVAAIGRGSSVVPFATGIRVSSEGNAGSTAANSTGAEGTIVNNSGTLWAGVSIDSGATYVRGTAINTVFAPNAMDILLEGSAHAQPGFAGSSGLIYGNIFISTDDEVVVQNGKTCFNGVINQPYVAGTHLGAVTTVRSYPLTAPFLPNLYTAAGGTDPFVAAVAVGSLTVASNGTLDLVNDPRQGAAAAYVDNYFQAAGGELELEIRGIADGPGAINLGGDNTIGKIVAEDTAVLGGKLEIIPYAGLYTNTAYRIVSAGHIAGTWTDGANVLTNSVLLKASVSNNGTIATLNLTRVHFDAVPGLTANEEQAGDGLEGAYAALIANPTAHPGFASFVGKLFQVGSAAEFANDLQQLDGSQYGEQAEATQHSTRILNDTVGTHLQLTADGGSDSVGQLISGVSPAAGGTGIGKGNIWVSAYGNRSTIDVNSSDPSAKVNDRGIYIGVDFDMDQQSKFGFVAGHTTGDTNFAHDRNNAGLENHDVGHFNGWHLGAYGRYDAEPWYAQAILSYGTFTNDMTRNIFINPSSAGLCCSFPFATGSSVIAGTAKSSYDSHTYGANGEVGYRLDTDSAYDLTPFLSLSYIHASSDAFHETGLSGANLAINDASSTSLDSQLGLRFSTDWQWTDHFAVTPVIRAAWEHDWDNSAWTVNEAFWNAPAGSQFRITGGGNARDFASVGAGLGFKISNKVQATINYEGRYSSSEKDNAILGHVNIHW